jgi:tetratricopeptide (TPR) repeat protein
MIPKTQYLYLLLFAGCSASSQSCPEGINRLPMYGRVQKCSEQVEADKEFLADCDKRFPNRTLASQHHVNKGWEYFQQRQLDTAIMRFNQAWLLDSANATVYWGFASVLGMRKQYRASVPLFKKYLALNPKEANGWEGLSTSYGQMFFQTKDVALLQSSIDALKNCVKLAPQNARAYGQLAGAYSYFVQRDSARKYLAIADRLNPSAVNPEVRKLLAQ